MLLIEFKITLYRVCEVIVNFPLSSDVNMHLWTFTLIVVMLNVLAKGLNYKAIEDIFA